MNIYIKIIGGIMEYKILKDYLEQNHITMVELSRKINISRQSIYDWGKKGYIPSKYEGVVNKIVSSINEVSCQIEFDIEYGNGDFIVDFDMVICYDGNEWGIKQGVLEKNPVVTLDGVKCSIDQNDVIGLNMYIVRYETEISYIDQSIKYTLYCSSVKRRKHFIFNREKGMFESVKNAVFSNLRNGYSFTDIINYVKINELDIVLEVTSEQMDIVYREVRSAGEEREFYEFNAMGVFIKYDDYNYTNLNKNREQLRELFNIISDFKGYYRYLNIILLCPDYVKKCLRKARIVNGEDGKNVLENISLVVRTDGGSICKSDLFEKVFLHECGHLIFSYNEGYDVEFEERRANYFASFVYNGKYDLLILFISGFQSMVYRSPLVKPISVLYYYEMKLYIEKLDELINNYKDYYTEVEKLYYGK